jgi:hypothetical protein
MRRLFIEGSHFFDLVDIGVIDLEIVYNDFQEFGLIENLLYF